MTWEIGSLFKVKDYISLHSMNEDSGGYPISIGIKKGICLLFVDKKKRRHGATKYYFFYNNQIVYWNVWDWSVYQDLQYLEKHLEHVNENEILGQP